MTGLVAATFRKREKGAPMEPVAHLVCRARHGIEGDRGAQADSARQVLLVDGHVLDEVGLDDGALRENITVRGLSLDALQSGTALVVGEVELRLTIPCDPCGPIGDYANVDQRRITGRRGILAVVTVSGRIQRGDEVVDQGVRYHPIPVAPMRRCEWVARRVPPGEVVTFDQVRRAIGMAKGYVRTMPRHVRRLMAEGAPAHRLVPGDPEAVLDDEQAVRLRQEGVAVTEDNRLGAVTPWTFIDPFYEPLPDRTPGPASA